MKAAPALAIDKTKVETLRQARFTKSAIFTRVTVNVTVIFAACDPYIRAWKMNEAYRAREGRQSSFNGKRSPKGCYARCPERSRHTHMKEKRNLPVTFVSPLLHDNYVNIGKITTIIPTVSSGSATVHGLMGG